MFATRLQARQATADDFCTRGYSKKSFLPFPHCLMRIGLVLIASVLADLPERVA
jgi:hypothetical protein